jgi:uncharacterized repeat protein (TIGR02543 family)
MGLAKRLEILGSKSIKKTKNLIKARTTFALAFSLSLTTFLILSSFALITQPVLAAPGVITPGITAYSLPGETGPAAINSGAGTIDVTLPHGTDITAMVATFSISAGTSLIEVGTTPQASGITPNNFTSPVTYTVIAMGGILKKNWVVTVTIVPSSDKSISAGAEDTNDTNSNPHKNPSTSSGPTADVTVTPMATTNETLTINITGNGTVAQTLTSGSSPSAGSYASYSEVQLTATPAPGWTFTGWGGPLNGLTNPSSITMSTNLTVTATFQIVPTVTTVSSSVGQNSVTLTGNISSFGGSPVLTSAQVCFEWGLGTDYGSVTPLVSLSATGTYTATITGIAAGTTYHYRAMATGAGTGYGADATFTTPAATANPTGWWNSSWNYRAEIDIAGTGTALSNYQISLAVPYNSNMAANFADVRFVAADNATVLNYWLQGISSGSPETATFWVEIPSIAASGITEIYMYYGDSSALTTSNIHTTFIFGDDFADPTYTNAHIIAWNGGASSQGIVNNNGTPLYEMSGDNTSTTNADRSEPIAQIYNNGSLMAFPANYIAEYNVEAFDQDDIAFINARYLTVNWKYEQALDFGYSQVVENKVVNTAWTNLGFTALGYQLNTNTMYDFKSVVSANGSTTTLQTYLNGTQIGPNVSDTSLPYPTYSGFAFLTFNDTAPFKAGYQDVRIRQYAVLAPVVTLGAVTKYNYMQIGFISAAQTIAAGVTSSAITIESQDTGGNPVNVTSSTVVNLTSSSNGGSFSLSPVTIPAGSDTATFYYTDTAVGNPTITAASAGLTGGTQQETITPGAVSQIRVETMANGTGTIVPSQTVNSGSSITCYAITRDKFGNFIANAAGNWSLTSTTGSVVAGDLVPSGDTTSAVFMGHLAGTAIIQVTSGTLTNTPSGTLTVIVASVTKISVSGYASPSTAGTAGAITVTAQDGSGNTITTYGGTVHFTSTDSQASLPANYTFVSGDHGTHTFTATLKTSGSQSITATDTIANTITGTQSGIIINSAKASQIRVETVANGTGAVVPAQNVASGSSITVYAVTRDQYGNFVAGATGSWSLISITGGVTKSNLVPSANRQNAVFTGNLAGTAIIQVTSTGLTSVNSGTLTVVVASGNTTGVVASKGVKTGATNEYDLYLTITSTTVPGVSVGEELWIAASTTNFPNLLTVGATISGNLSNATGWWVLK